MKIKILKPENIEYIELSILITSVFLLHLVPQIHANYFYGYDAFHETMQANDIILSQDIKGIYIHPPFYSLPMAILSIFSSSDVVLLIKFLMPFVIALIGVAIYFLTKEITENHNIALLSAIFLTLSSGIGEHFYFQFHLNFMETRSLYIGWLFLITSIFFLVRSLKKKEAKYSVLGGIFFGSTILSYYLVGISLAIASISVLLLSFVKRKPSSVDFKKIFKIFLVYFISGILVASIFIVPKIDYLKFVLGEMEGKVYFTYTQADYFYFYGITAILALIGITYTIKFRKGFFVSLWLIGLLILFQLYWVKSSLPGYLQTVISLPDRIMREAKVPVSILSAIGLYWIVEKIRKRNILKFVVTASLLALSMCTPIYGILYQKPFSNTDIIPVSALEKLNNMDSGKVLADDLTVAFVASFTDKQIFGGFHERAVDWSRKIMDDAKELYDTLQSSSELSPAVLSELKDNRISYLFINHYESGKFRNTNLDQNIYFDKIYDGDQATIFKVDLER